MKNNLLTIENNGAEIAATNYFESEYAIAGKVYLSVNAGVFRLLLPDNQIHMLEEISTGKEVVISIGKWPEAAKQIAFELMFDDHSDSPFCLHFGSEQVDRVPNDMQRMKAFLFFVSGFNAVPL